MSNRPDYLLWLDLESTGLTLGSQILEVGCILTEAEFPFVEQAESGWVVRPGGDWLNSMVKDVVEMHVRNGLIEDVIRTEPHRRIGVITAEVVDWLNEYAGTDSVVELAGSGVAAFDRRFIERYMIQLHLRLAYGNHDVGIVRRFLRAAGREELVAGAAPREGEVKAHRALPDIRDHLREYRAYAAYMREARTP